MEHLPRRGPIPDRVRGAVPQGTDTVLSRVAFPGPVSRCARPVGRHRPGRDGFPVVPLWWHPMRFGNINSSKEKQEQPRLHLGAAPAEPVGTQHRRHHRIATGTAGAASRRPPRSLLPIPRMVLEVEPERGTQRTLLYPRQCPAPRQVGHGGLRDPPAGPQGPPGFGGVPQKGRWGFGFPE